MKSIILSIKQTCCLSLYKKIFNLLSMHTKNKLLKKLTKNIDILPDVGTHIQFFYFVIYIYIHTFNTYDRIGVFVAQKKRIGVYIYQRKWMLWRRRDGQGCGKDRALFVFGSCVFFFGSCDIRKLWYMRESLWGHIQWTVICCIVTMSLINELLYYLRPPLHMTRLTKKLLVKNINYNFVFFFCAYSSFPLTYFWIIIISQTPCYI